MLYLEKKVKGPYPVSVECRTRILFFSRRSDTDSVFFLEARIWVNPTLIRNRGKSHLKTIGRGKGNFVKLFFVL